MFSFLSNLFGGSDSKQQSQQQATSASSSQGQSTSNASSTPGNYNPFTSMLSGNIGNLINSLGGGAFGSFPTPQGPFAAPMSAGESNILGALPQGAGSLAGARGYLSDVLSGKYLTPGSNPFLQGAITSAQTPTLQNLDAVLQRDLPSQFIQAGHVFAPGGNAAGGPSPTGSTAFDTAAGTAVTNAARAISDIATNMGNSAYQAERTIQQQAIPLAEGEVQTTISNLQAQALPRLIQQMGITQGTQVFQDTVSKVLDFLKTVGGIAAPAIANQSQSQAQSTQSATSNAQSAGSATGQSNSISGNPFASLFGGDRGSGGMGNFIDFAKGGASLLSAFV